MTDRVKGLTITFEEDIRIDDVKAMIDAIYLFKGIAHVEPSIVTGADHVNRSRITAELKNKLYNFIKDELV